MDIYQGSSRNDTNQSKEACNLTNKQYSYSNNNHSQTTHYHSIVIKGDISSEIICDTNNDCITSTQENQTSYTNKYRSLNENDSNRVKSTFEHDNDKSQQTILQNQLKQYPSNTLDYYESNDTNHHHHAQSTSSSPESSIDKVIDIDYSILSNLANIFIQRIKALRYIHELFCANEYPDSFTGEEAIIPETYCIKIANALMKNRPALFEPVHYSQKSLIHNTVYNAQDEIYHLNEDQLPKGILTSLTKCYTYGCKYDDNKNGCYSPLCPNKSKIFKYEFLTGSNLSRKNTMMSIISINKETSYPNKAWAERVPIELLESITQCERDRQEAINEIIYSEEVYRNDLNTLHELVVVPLLNNQTIITKNKERIDFINQVFNNYNELRDISSALIKDLFRLQRRHRQKCIPCIGEIMIQHARFFERPFTTYCSAIPLSEYLLSNECESNKRLDSFLNQVIQQDRFRRLTFRHFLLNPVTRMQRYKLLLSAVLKKTDHDHPDYPFLIRCIDIMNDIAKKSDLGTVHFKQCVEIAQINDALIFKSDEAYDLQLNPTYRKERKLYHQGGLYKKPMDFSNDKPDMHIFVFDHVLLMTKPSISKAGHEIYHVWKKPLLLNMLFIEDVNINTKNEVNEEDDNNKEKTPFSLSNGSYRNKLTLTRKNTHDKITPYYPLVLRHLEQRKKTYTFYCHSLEEKISWVNAIQKAKKAQNGRHHSGKDGIKLCTLNDFNGNYTGFL